jgi:hypothetical protein
MALPPIMTKAAANDTANIAFLFISTTSKRGFWARFLGPVSNTRKRPAQGTLRLCFSISRMEH